MKGAGHDVDVVVVGLGSMGSMALRELARSGANALGIDQFGPVHAHGSYTGESRLFRTAAKEGRVYMPLLQQAVRLWHELERDSGREVLLQVGALSVAPAALPPMQATLAAIREFDLSHHIFDADELRRKYPQFHVEDSDIGVLDVDGGALRPEVAVFAATDTAVADGAQVSWNTPVLAIREEDDAVVVETSHGPIRAGRAIVTAGSWSNSLLPELASVVWVEELPLLWFLPRHPELFTPDRFPGFMRDLDGMHAFGVPMLDGYSIKVSGRFDWGRVDHPSEVRAGYTREELVWWGEQVQRMIPDVVPEPVHWSVHHDSWTEDSVPVIDRVGGGRVVVVAGLSGNGFKLAPVYGRLAADLALEGASPWQDPLFTWDSHRGRHGATCMA